MINRNFCKIAVIVTIALLWTEFVRGQTLEVEELRKLKRYSKINVPKRKVNLVEHLDLSNSNLEHVPCEIAKFVNLKILVLKGNRIKSVPVCLKDLDSLIYVDLSSNGLDSIPCGVGEFKNLKYLLIANNRIKNIDSCVVGLKNLKRLFACYNPMVEDDAVRLRELMPGCIIAVTCLP